MSFYVLRNTISFSFRAYVVKMCRRTKVLAGAFRCITPKACLQRKVQRNTHSKARMPGSYRYPDAKGAAQETSEHVVAHIRENMQSRCDGTARTLGCTESRRWVGMENP
jgi:hypothetical protein